MRSFLFYFDMRSFFPFKICIFQIQDMFNKGIIGVLTIRSIRLLLIVIIIFKIKLKIIKQIHSLIFSIFLEKMQTDKIKMLHVLSSEIMNKSDSEYQFEYT